MEYIRKFNENKNIEANRCITDDKEKYLVKYIITERKCRITTRTIQRDLKSLYKKAKIDENKYSVHTLRHTCATILYKSGYDIKLIQEILGHSSVNTTKIYTHLYDKEVEKTMQEHPLAHFKMKNTMEFCAL